MNPITIVGFAEPKVAGRVERAYANVNYEALSEEQTPEQYLDGVLPLMEEVLPEFQLLSREAVTIDGLDGLRISYSMDLSDTNMTLLTYVLIKDKRIYVLSGGSVTERFADLEEMFDTMYRDARIN